MSEDPDDATPGRPEGDGADPLSDLDVDLDHDDGGVPEDAFEEVDVGDVDEDAAWNRLSDDDLEAVSGEVVVVPKRTYCERCEHFSDPPEVSCEHPGTEIHRLADMDHFRVENCPVVAERRRTGGEPEDE